VVTDPPPPVEAAGSSLLYSEEFYELVKQHLKPNGIIQVWFPGGDVMTGQAILRSLQNSFTYVRCFAVSGDRESICWLRCNQSNDAQPSRSPPPCRPRPHMTCWNGVHLQNLPEYLDRVLSARVSTQALLNRDLQIRITDDQPYNEYFFCGDRDCFRARATRYPWHGLIVESSLISACPPARLV